MIHEKAIHYYKKLDKKDKRYIRYGIALFGLYKLVSRKKDKEKGCK